MSSIIAFILSAAGVLLGGAVTYVLNVRQAKVTYSTGLFQAAIAAIATAQAARSYPVGISEAALLSPQQTTELESKLRADGVMRWYEFLAQARIALAQVIPYRPDLKHFLDDDSVIDNADELIAELRLGKKEDA